MALTWTYESKLYTKLGEIGYNTHTIEIIDRNGGINGTFCGTSEGARIISHQASRDVLGPLVGSGEIQFTMRIENDTHVAFIDALQDFNERRFIVQYKRNGQVYMTGMIFLDEVVIDYRSDVRKNGTLSPDGFFSVTAIDGITQLKEVEYNQGPLGLELPWRGRATIAEVLGRCFDSLVTYGYGQQIVLKSNWKSDLGGYDFFQDTQISQEVLFEQGRQGGYKYMSKYDVIKEICKTFDLRLSVQQNAYVFEHLNATVTGSAVTIGTYGLDGSTGVSGSVSAPFGTDIDCDGFWRLSPDIRTVQPPLQVSKVIYKFDFNGNYLSGISFNSTTTSIDCSNSDLGAVPVPNDTTRLRWAGTVQYIPRNTSGTAPGQQVRIIFYFQIKVGNQYYVRELADDTLNPYYNFTYSTAEWTTTAGYYTEVWQHLITLPDSFEQSFYAPFFITTLPLDQALDGEQLSVCFGHELYDVDGNLISPSDTNGFGVEHYLDDSDLIVLDQDNNLIESTQIDKVVYNGTTADNTRGHIREILFSTGPNDSSENRLTDTSSPVVSHEEWTGDQGTYPHYELLARTLMSRAMNTQEFLEGVVKGGRFVPYGSILYDGKKWIPLRVEYITGIENYAGEWYYINLGDASGLPDTEEDIKYINRLPNGFGTGTGNGLTPVVNQLEGVYRCIDVDSLGIPIPDTTNWTESQIAARIEVYKQSVGLLFYRDPPIRVDEWAWDNDNREICLGEQTRAGDKLIIRVWVG